MKILEIKRHLNKPDESYLCDLFRRHTDYLVLKYVSSQPGRVAFVTFEAGSTTYAYYRSGSGYVLWRMVGPDHELKGHLFHICRDQAVWEDRVEYLDLLLDIWIDARDQLSILDRDEVEGCVAEGMLNEQDLAWIARQEQEIIKNRRQIISDFDAILCPSRNEIVFTRSRKMRVLAGGYHSQSSGHEPHRLCHSFHGIPGFTPFLL